LNELMRILNEVRGQPADVDQAAAVGPKVHKHTKVGDTNDESLEHHATLEVVQSRHFAEQRHWKLKITTVCKRELQAVCDTLHLLSPNLPTSRKAFDIDRQRWSFHCGSRDRRHRNGTAGLQRNRWLIRFNNIGYGRGCRVAGGFGNRFGAWYVR
jgi:hypothetical protein